MIELTAVTRMDAVMLDGLLGSSRDEGYHFVQTLLDDYEAGEVTFSEDEAQLLGAYHNQKLIAIGGIHIDPYLDNPKIGRIRHVYVLPDFRRDGVGRLLVKGLLEHAQGYYSSVTLRTLTAHGDAFYRAIGFQNHPRFDQATHWIDIT